MWNRVYRGIRTAVWRGEYEISVPHFLEELAADELLLQDAETAILTGRVVRRFTGDPRGPRYVIRGRTTDGRTVEIVLRKKADHRPLLITAYVVRSEHRDEEFRGEEE